LNLIVSCSNLPSSPNPSSSTQPKTETKNIDSPQIPFSNQKAFYQLRKRIDGKILPSYQWKVCVKRIIVCTKWEMKTVFYEDLTWFMANEFGLMKRPNP
jgi:hypothetical protein